MKVKKQNTGQGGFTLVELLIVIGILAILLAITLIALNPIKHFQSARNAQRQSDVVTILDAIYDYEAANRGNLPPSISTVTTTPSPLAKGGTGSIDTCSDLTPNYVADLPTDPGSGVVTGGTTPCASGVTAYDTGYTIAKTAANRLTIAAPSAEGGQTISVTR